MGINCHRCGSYLFGASLIFVICLSVVGCRKYDIDDGSDAGRSIASFNAGSEQLAINQALGAKRGARYYLVAQYIIFDAVRENVTLTAIKGDVYNDLMGVDLAGVEPGERKSYLAAQGFMMARRESINAAKAHLVDNCQKWFGLDLNLCLSVLLDSAYNQYFNSKDRFDALNLYEASILSQLFGRISDQELAYYGGIAFSAINVDRSVHIFLELRERGYMTKSKEAAYCDFLAAHTFARVCPSKKSSEGQGRKLPKTKIKGDVAN